MDQHRSSVCRKYSKVVMAMEKFRWDIRGALPKWQSPSKALLGCFFKRARSRGYVFQHIQGGIPPQAPALLCALGEEATKLGCGLLPGLEEHLGSAPKLSSEKMSPGAVKG